MKSNIPDSSKALVEQDTLRLSSVLQKAPDPLEVEQDTLRLSSIPQKAPDPLEKVVRKLPSMIQRPFVYLLKRAGDNEAEKGILDQKDANKVLTKIGSLFPLLLSALGLLLVAFVFTSARNGNADDISNFFYPCLMVICVPTIARLLSPQPSRTERIILVCIIGMTFYLIKVEASPLYFSNYDEFLHWRTVDDIARSGHLFTPNALLPVSPYYPGLEIVTNAFSTLSGMNSFISGLVVIGIARLLTVLVLFVLHEKLVRSARIASIAVLLYMANPHFLLFDSQFAYESLALPLALFVILAIASSQWTLLRLLHLKSSAPFVMFAKTGHRRLNGDLHWLLLIAWLALAALTVTHHVTDFFLDGILILWAIVYAFQHLVPFYRSNLIKSVILSLILAVAWISLKGNPVVQYITSFMSNAFQELGHIITGTGGARQLFASYNGQSTAIWERILTVLSVVLILVSLPFGLLSLWLRYRSNALISTFGLMAFAYPLSQAFRFTNSGAQLTDRAAAFLFIPVGLILSIFIAHFWPLQRWNWKCSISLTSAVLIVLLGGVMLGAGPSSSALPGPYEVGADARSINPESIKVALWTDAHLGPNNRIATDRTNQVLMGTFGDQRVVTSIGDDIDVSSVFMALSLGPAQQQLLQQAQAPYLVVDRRLSQSLPLLGFYFVEGEPGSYHRASPIPLAALTKFDTIPKVNRIFDSGDIVIYDDKGLIYAP